MEDTRVPKPLYNRFVCLDKNEDNEPEHNWCTQVRTYLAELDLENIWHQQTVNKTTINIIINKYRLKLQENDVDVNNTSKYSPFYKE